MDSDSTFHPASQLNPAFASPMTPMCVKRVMFCFWIHVFYS